MSALSLTVPTDATGPLGAQAPAQAISYDDLQGLTYLQVRCSATSLLWPTAAVHDTACQGA